MNANSFFNNESPLVSLLNRVGDLIVLNMLFLLCCIPIVTIGAALTAMHYVCLRMIRNEEGYITRDFFRSFRMNFRQSTLIWLLMMVVLLMVGTDIVMLPRTEVTYPALFHYILLADGVVVLAVGLYAFPLQARFVNPLHRTLWNAALLTVGSFPRTLAMLVLMVVPFIILFAIPQLLPIVVCMGFSSAVYACAALYDPVFRRMEPAPDTEDSPQEDENESI